MAYFVYLARCKDNSLYCGFCTDVQRRQQEHNAGTGAKYTRSRLPVEIVYTEECATKSSAMKREAHIKKWSKEKKENLVAGCLSTAGTQ